MPVAQQVADQPAVFADFLGADAIGHTRGLYDRGVGAHVIDDADKAVVENFEGHPKDFIECGDAETL